MGALMALVRLNGNLPPVSLSRPKEEEKGEDAEERG